MIPAGEWERCAPWIEAALEHADNEYTLADVLAEVVSGEAQFWPGERSAMVTQFFYFPRTKALNFWLAGGDLAELAGPMRTDAEAWAKMQGCSKIIIAGRAGWVRTLKGEGYRRLWTAMGKDL